MRSDSRCGKVYIFFYRHGYLSVVEELDGGIFMKSNRFFTARTIAYLAVLIALVVVLQLFASAIPMFGVTLNFSLIPIVLAGIFFGAYGGGLVGLVSGLVTFITTAVMGREPSTAFLFQASPVILTIVCIGKTTLAGVVARNTVSGDREKERTDCFLCRRAHRCGREYGNLSAGDGDHGKTTSLRFWARKQQQALYS